MWPTPTRHHFDSARPDNPLAIAQSDLRLRRFIPLPVGFDTFHTNPKRKRGKDLAPRLRFALSVSLDRQRYICTRRACPERGNGILLIAHADHLPANPSPKTNPPLEKSTNSPSAQTPTQQQLTSSRP